MKITLLKVSALGSILLASSMAQATAIMPDFASVPTDWVTDRYAPHSFSNVGTFQGRSDVLGIEIHSDEASANRGAQSSAYYNTQGSGHAVLGGSGSILSADLYISSSWETAANGHVRTDMWGVMDDGINPGDPGTDYAIIGFTNYGGDARLRLWDGDTTGWQDLTVAIAFDAWTSLAINLTDTSYEYLVNGVLVYSDTTIHGTTGFESVLMQAYNFGDPAIEDAIVENYTAHWSNTAAVPEPGILLLFSTGLAGLVGTRLRRKKRA